MIHISGFHTHFLYTRGITIDPHSFVTPLIFWLNVRLSHSLLFWGVGGGGWANLELNK